MPPERYVAGGGCFTGHFNSDGLPVRRIIWDGRGGNPIPYVSNELGMDPYKCSDALHQIKQAGGLGPQDATVIYDNGDVVDALNNEEIGNLYDEF